MIIGLIVAVVVFFAVDLAALAPWARILYLPLAVLGPVLWTAIGLRIGVSLRRAGIAQR